MLGMITLGKLRAQSRCCQIAESLNERIGLLSPVDGSTSGLPVMRPQLQRLELPISSERSLSTRRFTAN